MPVAVHLFMMQEDKVLLLRRYQTGYQDGNYSVPAGHLDGQEEVVAAAIREGAEECGVQIAPEDVQIVGVMHRRAEDERIDFFVAVHKWSGEVENREPHKCDDLSWFAKSELPDNIIPYVRHAIESFGSGVGFSSFGW